MICPLSARSRPLTRLTRLVFPAPFDPIRASTSPCLTVKSTPLTARLSPKDLVSAWVASRLISRVPLEPREHALRRAHDARGQRQHEDDQHDAEQQLPIGRESDGVCLEIRERDRADDGS